MTDRWKGLKAAARAALTQRDYSATSLPDRLVRTGVAVSELLNTDRAQFHAVWIPGVEIFKRKIFPQRHRGFFGEFARQEEGLLADIGLWPRQWAAARMFAGTAKGFHIHPPYIPEAETPERWCQRLFVNEPKNFAARPYDREQWDAMFFIQGRIEMFLVDERAGLPRRFMRFFLEGDDHRGDENAGIVIPPGVAHALRVEGTTDAIMVYGTSTKFDPSFEGRIVDSVESAVLPPEWEGFLRGGG